MKVNGIELNPANRSHKCKTGDHEFYGGCDGARGEKPCECPCHYVEPDEAKKILRDELKGAR